MTNSTTNLVSAIRGKLSDFSNLVSQITELEADLRNNFDLLTVQQEKEITALREQVESLGGKPVTIKPVQISKTPISSPLSPNNKHMRNNPSRGSFIPPPPSSNGVHRLSKQQKPRTMSNYSNHTTPRYSQDKNNNFPGPPPGPPPLNNNSSTNDSNKMGSPTHLNGVRKSNKNVTPVEDRPKIDLLPKNVTTIEEESKKPKLRMKTKKHKLPNNALSEREFYKKYWIEAGQIGEGAFARVRRIIRKEDKKVFALKMIKKKGKSKNDIIALQQEIYALQQCDHVNVVKLVDWCDTKKRIYMVVEHCDGGDVFERVIQMKKFSEEDATHVIKNVASGLGHIHSKGFVHRDLKPDNLMYLTKAVNSEIKIIDFGLAGDVSDGACNTPCGTAHYAAPEVLSNVPYGTQSDMWSLGVVLYTLLCGFPPFFDANNNLKNLYHMIKKAKFSFPSPFWDDVSDGAKDLVSKLLVKEPKKRLNSQQVLQHPWLNTPNKTNKQFSDRYINQMQHWQSTRHQTERALGMETVQTKPEEEKKTKNKIDIFAKWTGKKS